MDLHAARVAALKAAAHIDANVKVKLLKRAHKHGVTDRDEAVELAEAWKRAARRTVRLTRCVARMVSEHAE